MPDISQHLEDFNFNFYKIPEFFKNNVEETFALLNVLNFVLADSLKHSPELLFEIAKIMNIVSIVVLSLAVILVIRNIYKLMQSKDDEKFLEKLSDNFKSLAIILIRLSYAIILEVLSTHHVTILFATFLISLPEIALFFAALLKSADHFFKALCCPSAEDNHYELAKRYLKDSFRILGKAFLTLISVKNLLALIFTGIDVATLGTSTLVTGLMYSSFYLLFAFSPKLFEVLRYFVKKGLEVVSNHLSSNTTLTSLCSCFNNRLQSMASVIETSISSFDSYLSIQSRRLVVFVSSGFTEIEEAFNSFFRNVQPPSLFLDFGMQSLNPSFIENSRNI